MVEAPSVLSAHDVSVERGRRRVVEPLSFTLKPGEVTAICGPNGAGKSSLLMALAGLLPPASGSVQLDGTELAAIKPEARARAIGYLPQGGSVAWDIAVSSLVALGRHPHGDAGGATGARAVERALKAAQLEALASRPLSQLSGGERARALLARVLAGEPRWILTDEPLAALDLAHQLRLMAHLRRCTGAPGHQGVVIVLHDLATAMNQADRVLVLKQGALIADGPPHEALAPEVIAQGWGVTARWLGEESQRALATQAQ
ncbi:MAG: ABC transporter ATP-binding protein [Pseudomonadota bacterium]